MDWGFITVTLLDGLARGLYYFLVSAGLTLIFSMMGVLNFAHASFFMLGGYFAYIIAQEWGLTFWIALPAVPLIVGAIGMVVERFGLRHVHKFANVAELIFTFGLAFLLQEFVKLVFGQDTKPYAVPEVLQGTLFTVGDQPFGSYRAFMILVSISIFIGLYLLLTRTRVGMIIQAALTHPNTVSNLGHNVPLIFMAVFGVGTALAALAGVIALPTDALQPGSAARLGPIIFVIIVVGGLGSLNGALVASMIIGILTTMFDASQLSVFSVMEAIANMLGIEWSLLERPTYELRRLMVGDLIMMSTKQVGALFPYLLMVLILIFRPQGLLGKRES